MNPNELQPLLIVEVGSPSENPISGMRWNYYGDLPNRVLSVEPFDGCSAWDDSNSDAVNYAQEHGIPVWSGDIYDVQSEWPEQSVGLLILENVLSDPQYSGRKTFDIFAQNAQRLVVQSGLVFICDGLYNPFTHHMYEAIRRVMENSGFTVLVDDIVASSIGNFAQSRNNRLNLVKTALQNLGILDEPINEA